MSISVVVGRDDAVWPIQMAFKTQENPERNWEGVTLRTSHTIGM